jgi:predicted nucleotidyltransferase
MDREDKELVKELKQKLGGQDQRHVTRFIAFGSRARGEAREDSDLDLIVLVDEKTPELEKALEDAAYAVMWDHDFKPIISLKVFAQSRFRSAVEKGFSFYKQIEREGISL